MNGRRAAARDKKGSRVVGTYAGAPCDNSIIQHRRRPVKGCRLFLNDRSGTIERDGKPCTVIHYDLGSDLPVTDLPESLTFIPVNALPRQESEPSTAYWQRVADLAKAEDCFTIKLK